MVEEESTSIISAGTLICATTLCVASVVSCVVLKSRGTVCRGGLVSADPTSAPLCRLCCHQQKIDHSDELQTKGWTCSACNGYNPSTEVSSGDIDEDLNDLEIQHTLGSLAISQTRAPKVRASPQSWLHSIKDLNLLTEQTPNQISDDDGFKKNEQTFAVGTSSNCASPSPLNGVKFTDEVKDTCLASSFNGKPLIQPARLQVRKRQQSLSSATAALSLAGNGWSLNSHVTERRLNLANGAKPSHPFISRGLFVNGRNSSPDLRSNFSSSQLGCSNHQRRVSSTYSNAGPHFTNGNRTLTNGGMDNSYQHDDLNTLNMSGLNPSQTTMDNHHGYEHSPTMHMPTKPQPCPAGPRPVVNGNKSPPLGKGISCPVATLIVVSLSTNVILILLLAAFIYSPNAASSIL